MEKLLLGQKIGAGGFRDCYEVCNHPNLCAKVIRARRITTMRLFALKFDIKLPMFLSSIERFGRYDLNSFELDMLSRLPEEIADYSLKNSKLAKTSDNRSVLVSERPMNHDGSFSKTIEDYGPISNTVFWRHMDRLIQIMKDENSQLLDINPKNIVVKSISDYELVPVFIDVKHLSNNGSTTRKIFGLGRSKAEKDSKLDHRYTSLKKRYRVVSDALSMSA